jgi:hypothetical protein
MYQCGAAHMDRRHTDMLQMFEKPTDQLAALKIDMLDKTTYCTQRRNILLDDTAKNLKDGKRAPKASRLRTRADANAGNWEFIVDL